MQCLFHGDKIVGHTIAHKAARAPVDGGIQIDLRAALDLTAKNLDACNQRLP